MVEAKCVQKFRNRNGVIIGYRHWYSEEQERELGHTEDVCDADSLDDDGHRIIHEFFADIEKKYNKRLGWTNYEEKGYSSIYIED